MANNTTTTKKVTKAQRNEDIILILQGEHVKYGTTVDEAIAHLTHENELLSKKNTTKSGSKKLTKDQLRNRGFQNTILAYLSENPALLVSATDVMEKVLRPAYPTEIWSNQKAASLLNGIADKYDKDTGELTDDTGLLYKYPAKGKQKTTYKIKPECVGAAVDTGEAAE